MIKTTVIIHTGRYNYRSLKVTKADELKLITMFSSKEIHGKAHIKVTEEAYQTIFNLTGV